MFLRRGVNVGTVMRVNINGEAFCIVSRADGVQSDQVLHVGDHAEMRNQGSISRSLPPAR